VGEPFWVVLRFVIVDACFESKDNSDKVHDLGETPLEGSHDVFGCEDFPSLGCHIILPNRLDRYPLLPPCIILRSPLIVL